MGQGWQGAAVSGGGQAARKVCYTPQAPRHAPPPAGPTAHPRRRGTTPESNHPAYILEHMKDFLLSCDVPSTGTALCLRCHCLSFPCIMIGVYFAIISCLLTPSAQLPLVDPKSSWDLHALPRLFQCGLASSRGLHRADCRGG